MDCQSPMAFNSNSPLHVAVKQGQIEDVRNVLIQQQVDVNILNSKHETPLHLACFRGDSALIQFLVAFGADPFIKDSNEISALNSGSFDITKFVLKLLFCHDLWINGPAEINNDTPLHTAVRLGMLDDVQRLIEEKIINVNEINASHESPLHVACALGYKHVVQALTSNGANLYMRDCYNNAPIHRAVSQGRIDIIDCLINDCACDPNIKGYQDRTLLHFACGIGNVNLINTLIQKHGISPMVTDTVNQTPLHIAASHGQEEVVCLLIARYNCLVDCRSNHEHSPLHLACYCGHISIVRTLVHKYKADMNALDDDGNTPFLKAAMGGNLELIHMMITDFDLDPLSTIDNSRNTPLHMACMCGHKELARLLITRYNCHIDVIGNNRNETPLHLACSSGCLSTVRMLVTEFKADISLRNSNSDTAVSLAAKGGHVETVQALITDLGCSPSITGHDGRSLLHEACCSGNIKLTEMLVTDFSLDISYSDGNGDTPLHMACQCGHEELARLLITKYNCLVDVKNNINETPFHKACLSGHPSVVRMLLSEFKAGILLQNHDLDATIHEAARDGHTEIVQILITELGCSPKDNGRSLIHEACWSGNSKLVEMLITEFNIDILSIIGYGGNTPLHWACLYGHEELARLLITRYKCLVDIKNKNKETPLHVACSSGHLGVVQVLVPEFIADKLLQKINCDFDAAIHKAARDGHVKIVQILITELGCSPNVTGYDGGSLLHEACWSGNYKLAEMLITEFNLDTLSVDYSGNTPLHLACWGGHEELARLLITKYNCPVDIKNENEETPLYIVCSSGHLSVVRVLVSEFKADTFLQKFNNDFEAAIHKAARYGHAKIVQILITELGCSPKVTGYNGRSLLHAACWSGNSELAEMLITEFNLDVQSVDDIANTPLHIACQFGHEELARLLITKYNCPVDIQNEDKWTPLHIACFRGHLHVSKVLIELNVLLGGDKRFCNTLDKDGNTPLDLVIKNGDAKAVHVLSTEYSCKPHVKGAESKPLLHQLAVGGFITMLKKLLSNFNHDPASVDEDGNTILHTAAQHGQLKVVEFLITNRNNQCPIDHRNSQGQTALHYACISGHTKVAKFLVASKADITVKDKDGDTPFKKAFVAGYVLAFFELFDSNLRRVDSKLLHQVCERGSVDLIDILLSDFNLDPSSVLDKQGNQALHIATLQGHKQVIVLLIKKYKCPVDSRNFSGQTPLHLLCSQLLTENGYTLIKMFIACSRGLLDISEVSVSEYNNIMLKGDKGFCNILDNDGNTPLDLAIKRGDVKTVHILCTECGCQPYISGAESQPLLHQLAAGGFITILKKLISNFNYDPASIDDNGNTILHAAAQHGQLKVVEFLITNYNNQCPIDHRNTQGQTALHYACISGHTEIAKFLVASKADLTVKDEDGDSPLKKAFVAGYVLTFFELFDSNLRRVDSKLLHQVCERGSVDLIDILFSDFNLDPSSVLDEQGNQALHIATLQGHKQVIVLLTKKYKCPIDSRNFSGQTPLQLLCTRLSTDNDQTLIKMLVTEFKSDVTSEDRNGDQPVHTAAQTGLTRTMVSLIFDLKCSSKSRGFKQRTLLHHALASGHTVTAKTLIEVFHLSLHCTDEDGNTPLHLSSLSGQTESVRVLLYDYHAPVYVRNKAGKTALDLATEYSTKKMIREYTKSEHKRIQREYDELRTKSLQKYSGQQIITRVFVLGNPGSGKSTLVEALKRKGLISSFFTVTEADVPPHTAGIVPSVYQSKDAGRLLYYDFAGDKEYFSSHAAILEIVSHSTVGNNVYFIVIDSRKDDITIHNEIGYWLSFISYHSKALNSQCRLKIIIILSHSDHLSFTDSATKVTSMKQYLHAHMNQYNEIFYIVEVISSNCRSPHSSRSIETILQQTSKDTPPCSISYEASLLHGLLEKDFSNVVACKFQDL